MPDDGGSDGGIQRGRGRHHFVVARQRRRWRCPDAGHNNVLRGERCESNERQVKDRPGEDDSTYRKDGKLRLKSATTCRSGANTQAKGHFDRPRVLIDGWAWPGDNGTKMAAASHLTERLTKDDLVTEAFSESDEGIAV